MKRRTTCSARAAAGELPPLALRLAETELDAARAALLHFEKQYDTDWNAIELLVGAPVLAALLRDGTGLDTMLSTHEISSGLPSDLLRQRPDIRAAEHMLIGANANIGAARAAYFPRIDLSTASGSASGQLSGMFSGHGWIWSVVPRLSIPIFDGERLDSELQVSQTDRDIAVARYESVIQAVFHEVADALAQRRIVQAELEVQRKRAKSAHAAFELVSRNHERGIAGYLEVLDAQRTVFAVQQEQVDLRLARQTNMVTL